MGCRDRAAGGLRHVLAGFSKKYIIEEIRTPACPGFAIFDRG
jgi:hypothetical protein